MLVYTVHQINCLCIVDDHLYAIYKSETPYRYHMETNKWQCVATCKSRAYRSKPEGSFCNKAAAVFRSCIYVLHGQRKERLFNPGKKFYEFNGWEAQVAAMFCFNPKRNEWERKTSTRTNHFGSSLFVVNNRLYIAGGKCSVNPRNGDIDPHGKTGSV